HEYIDEHPELAKNLLENIKYYCDMVRQINSIKDHFNLHSPIQRIILGANEKAAASAARLMDYGFNARAILPPTVKEGSSRLRICIHAQNSRKELDQLVNALSLIV
ncbi:MAG: aminotransferase class I/II-fold pyridoxal phosphate-dependent enzyme, partial [Cyclobacteriaceae bacterium]